MRCLAVCQTELAVKLLETALQPSFELHEGTEVRVLEVRGGAVRVRLGNGLEGWIAATDLEVV